MLNRNFSITSRTGYSCQTVHERLLEVAAILTAIICVAGLIALAVAVSRLM